MDSNNVIQEGKISIIIPAYNEQDHIENLLSSLFSELDNKTQYEVIIIDNGSTDKTVEIASKFKVEIYSIQRTFVSTARNFGVSKSSGGVLVFLDADVVVTDVWADTLPKSITSILENYKLVTGSKYWISLNPTWIENAWFSSRPEVSNNGQVNYINSGNLLISRKLYDEIDGFDESLESGEDYELCTRAKKHGAVVQDNESLKAIHNGYPKDLRSFMKREIWHGKGDFVSLKNIFASKVAIVTIIFLFTHMYMLYALVAVDRVNILFSASVILIICVAVNIYKFKFKNLFNWISNLVLNYMYFLARAISFISVLKERIVVTRQLNSSP